MFVVFWRKFGDKSRSKDVDTSAPLSQFFSKYFIVSSGAFSLILERVLSNFGATICKTKYVIRDVVWRAERLDPTPTKQMY